MSKVRFNEGYIHKTFLRLTARLSFAILCCLPCLMCTLQSLWNRVWPWKEAPSSLRTRASFSRSTLKFITPCCLFWTMEVFAGGWRWATDARETGIWLMNGRGFLFLETVWWGEGGAGQRQHITSSPSRSVKSRCTASGKPPVETEATFLIGMFNPTCAPCKRLVWVSWYCNLKLYTKGLRKMNFFNAFAIVQLFSSGTI